MKTTIDKTIYLAELITEEIRSERGSYLPLFDLHQLCIDYAELLRDVEMEKEMHKRKDH